MRSSSPDLLAQLLRIDSSSSEQVPLLPARALPLSQVRLGVECPSMESLFESVAQAVAGSGRPRPEQVVRRLSSRHRRSSPAIGRGWALPHAAVPVIRRPLAVYLRLRQPLRLLNDDDDEVSDCLALLAPAPGFLDDHVMLERVSAFLLRPDSSDALRACAEAAAVRRLLTGCG